MQIKFIGWDDEIGEIVEPHKIDFNLGWAYYIDSNEDIQRVKVDNLMQYTGLKDKNGVEIYEKYVLRSSENDEVYKVEDIFPLHRHTHVINIGYFSDKKYHLRTHTSRYNSNDDWMSWPEMYEVIGNIYETPELLK